MRNERGSALLAILALVAVVALVEGIFLIRLSSRVEELESGASAPGSGPESPRAVLERVRSLEDMAADTAVGLDSVAKATERLQRESVSQAEAIDRLGVSLRPVPERGAGADAPAAAVPESALRQAVARAVEEKLDESRRKGGGGEWKPTLQQLEEALDLSEDQTTRAEQVLDDAKHEVFQLACIPRDDGTPKIEDFVRAFQDPDDPEAAMKKVFSSLFTEKIPGRQETYIAEILRIRNGAEQSLQGLLDEAQRKKLGRMNIDYLGVHTSYDPFGEYIQESVR